MERAKYPDGRLIPIAGDKVFQAVRGPFGTPAYMHGEVYAGKGRRGGLRVKITHVAAMFGGAASGKTYPLTEYWSVENDPELARREAAREAAREAKQIAEQQSKDRQAATRAAWHEKYGETDFRKFARGDLVAGLQYDAESLADEQLFVVGEFSVGRWGKWAGQIEIYGWPVDQIEYAPGGLGGRLRLIEAGKFAEHQLPEPGIGAMTAPPTPAEVAAILAESKAMVG